MNVWYSTAVFAMELYAGYRYIHTTGAAAKGYRTIMWACCAILVASAIL